MSHAATPEPYGEDLAACAIRAVSRAAEELETTPGKLARRLQNGEIAELIHELQIARALYLYGHDRERLDELLTRLGVSIPSAPSPLRTPVDTPTRPD